MNKGTKRRTAGLMIIIMWSAFWVLATIVGEMVHGANRPETIAAIAGTLLLTGVPVLFAARRPRIGAIVLAVTGLALAAAILVGTDWFAIPPLRLMVLGTLPVPPLIAAVLMWSVGEKDPITVYEGMS